MWQIAYSTMNQLDARLLLMELDYAGIEARMQSDHLLTINPLWDVWAPLQILVRRDQAAEAKKVIAKFSATRQLEQEERNGAVAVLFMATLFSALFFVESILLFFVDGPGGYFADGSGVYFLYVLLTGQSMLSLLYYSAPVWATVWKNSYYSQKISEPGWYEETWIKEKEWNIESEDGVFDAPWGLDSWAEMAAAIEVCNFMLAGMSIFLLWALLEVFAHYNPLGKF